jgi:hypothetical protein
MGTQRLNQKTHSVKKNKKKKKKKKKKTHKVIGYLRQHR